MALLPNPFIQLKAAANGDLEAMRALADNAIELVVHGHAEPCRTLSEGLIFARMAAVRGTVADKGRALGMLALLGQLTEDDWLANDTLAEGIAMVSTFADSGEDGEELAANGLNLVVENATPEDLERAKIYIAAMKEAY